MPGVDEHPIDRRLATLRSAIRGRHLALQRPRRGPCALALAGREHPLADRRPSSRPGSRERRRVGLLDRERDVDPVGERAAELRLVGADRGGIARAVAASGAPRPHGHGLAAATSRKRHGSSTAYRARAIVTAPSSSGWRSASSAARELAELVEEQHAVVGERHLAGARRRAAADQPGRRDRVVRGAERPPPGDRGLDGRPQALAIRATSIASAGPSGGRIEGSRRAASDLPAPGGPMTSRLCPPAAATSSPRRRPGWPLQVGEVRQPDRRSGRGGRGGCRMRRLGAVAQPAKLRERFDRGRPAPSPASAASAAARGAGPRSREPPAARRPRPSPARPARRGSSRRGRARRRARRPSSSRLGQLTRGGEHRGGDREVEARARPCAGRPARGWR